MTRKTFNMIQAWAAVPAYQRRDALESIRTLAKTQRAFVGLIKDGGYQDRQNDKADALEAAAELLDAVVLDVATLTEADPEQLATLEVRLPMVALDADALDGRR